MSKYQFFGVEKAFPQHKNFKIIFEWLIMIFPSHLLVHLILDLFVRLILGSWSNTAIDVLKVTLSHSQSTLFLYIEQICCFTQYTGYNVFSIRTKSNSQFSTRTTYNSDLPVQSYASKADKTLECINEPLNLLIIASSSYYIRILVANSQLAPALLKFQLKCG